MAGGLIPPPMCSASTKIGECGESIGDLGTDETVQMSVVSDEVLKTNLSWTMAITSMLPAPLGLTMPLLVSAAPEAAPRLVILVCLCSELAGAAHVVQVRQHELRTPPHRSVGVAANESEAACSFGIRQNSRTTGQT